MASLPLPLGPGLKRGPPSSPLWGEPVGQEEPGVDTASPSCRCSFSRPGLSQGHSLPPAPLALMSFYGLTAPIGSLSCPEPHELPTSLRGLVCPSLTLTGLFRCFLGPRGMLAT